MTTTLARVPEPREIDDEDAAEIVAALQEREKSQVRVEKAVAKALKAGASVRAVQDATGLSPNTIRNYGARYGWPTAENRRNFNASRYPRS